MILYYILILSLPLISHSIFGRTLGGITVEKYLGALCLSYAIFYLGSTRRVLRPFATGQACAFLLFFILATVSYFTLGASNSPEMMLVYSSHLIFFVTTVALIDSLRRLRWALLAAIGSIGWASLYVLREWQLGSAVYGPSYRPGYVTGDPNFFTASAILCLPIALRFATERRIRWERAYCWGCLIVALVAIMLAASRGGFLGLIAAFLFLVWRSRQRLKNFALLSLLIVAALVVSASSPLGRFLHPGHGDVESSEAHLSLWRGGLRMIQHHPFFGVGLGNFKSVVKSYSAPDEHLANVAHNTYLEMAAEMGIPGLLTFLAILFLTFRSLDRVQRQALAAKSALVSCTAGGIQAGLVGFSVSSFFVSAEFLKLFWFMVFLSACLPRLLAAAKRQMEKPAREPKPAPQMNDRATHPSRKRGIGWAV